MKVEDKTIPVYTCVGMLRFFPSLVKINNYIANK